jgi:tetratricopeptide (TPR) repeat protein
MRLFSGTLLLAMALPLAAQTPPIEQARALISHNENQRAADVLEKAIAQTPKNAEAHYLLGAAYGNLAQKASIFGKASLATKAQNELETAVQLDPNHLEARLALVQYYMLAPPFMGGGEEKAIAQANELRKRESFHGHRAWAFIYNVQKKTDLARKEYLDAVREQPSSPKAHISLAIFHIGEKNYAGAATEAETAVKLDPNYMPGWFWVGRAAVSAGTNYPRGEEA